VSACFATFPAEIGLSATAREDQIRRGSRQHLRESSKEHLSITHSSNGAACTYSRVHSRVMSRSLKPRGRAAGDWEGARVAFVDLPTSSRGAAGGGRRGADHQRKSRGLRRRDRPRQALGISEVVHHPLVSVELAGALSRCLAASGAPQLQS
jgi:hypothetical protein